MPHSLRIALRALGRHKLRTALTTLGMTIGVGAVITMVALGTGAQETVADEVRSAGTNIIRVDAGNFTRGGEESKIATGLGAAIDADARRRGGDRGDARREVRVERGQTARLGDVANTPTREYLQVFGTDAAYPQLYGWRAARGKFFEAAEVSAAAPVAVLGSGARDRLFGVDVNAVGRKFRSVIQRCGSSASLRAATMTRWTWCSCRHGAAAGARHLEHSRRRRCRRAGRRRERLASAIRPLLRARHHLDSDAAMARLRQGGLLGNQMPSRQHAECRTTSR